MYELVEHTADLKVRLQAPDLAALYASAVEMLREVLVGSSPVAGSSQVSVPPDVDDPGERFFRFVRELVFRLDAERFVPCELVGMEPPTVSGETFDVEKHTFQHAPKAVTRHQFAVERDSTGWRAVLVLDL